MALGDTLRTFTATDGKPPSSNPATLDVRSGAEDVEYNVLDYDDTTDENMDFADVMPGFYNQGEITIRIGWMASDTTVGPDDVRWRASIRAHAEDLDDLDTDTFASSTSATDTEASASGEIVVCEIVLGSLDSVQAGLFYLLRIGRDPDHADDDLVGDAELVFVEVVETS
jgi:hypothetical protein